MKLLYFFAPFLICLTLFISFFYTIKKGSQAQDIYKTFYSWRLLSDQHNDDLIICSELISTSKQWQNKIKNKVSASEVRVPSHSFEHGSLARVEVDFFADKFSLPQNFRIQQMSELVKSLVTDCLKIKNFYRQTLGQILATKSIIQELQTVNSPMIDFTVKGVEQKFDIPQAGNSKSFNTSTGVSFVMAAKGSSTLTIKDIIERYNQQLDYYTSQLLDSINDYNSLYILISSMNENTDKLQVLSNKYERQKILFELHGQTYIEEFSPKYSTRLWLKIFISFIISIFVGGASYICFYQISKKKD